MKQKNKSIKELGINEKYNKMYLITDNNKVKPHNTKNGLTNIINSIGISNNEYSRNFNTNTYKNIKLKEKMMKFIIKQGKRSKIKDKKGKILYLDKIEGIGNNSNKENISFMSNRNNRNTQKGILNTENQTEVNISSINKFIDENNNKRNKKYNKSRAITFNSDCLKERLKTLDNKIKNNIDNRIIQNDDSYFNVNGRWQRGTISFNNFIKNKNNCSDNIKDKNDFIFNNKFKKRKNSYMTKKRLCLDNEEYFEPAKEKNLINKNNMISYNFRNSRSKIFNENTFSTSIDKDKSFNRNSLNMLEILKNSKSTRIILKPSELQSNNKKEINKEISKNELYKMNKEKNKEENKQIDLRKEDKKIKKKGRNIFNEIMDEVSQEKNYVQKIVHMKLIQGMNLLRQNSHREFNVRYNSKTYENSKVNEFSMI